MKSKEMFIYLASQSPRRKEILEKLKVPFNVVPSLYHEFTLEGVSPQEWVVRHAFGKVLKAKVPKSARFILGADTIVYCQRQVLGKPMSRKEAFSMLRKLSGRWHYVYTGVVLLDLKEDAHWAGFTKTGVYVKQLSKEDMEEYFETVNPMDKAGAYAIQEGPKIVTRIKGSYSNVVGLPVELLERMLEKVKCKA